MLGCIQPMSSPMMKRMLGFACCCCAAAGMLATVTATNNASRLSQIFLTMLMVLLVLAARDEAGSLRPITIEPMRLVAHSSPGAILYRSSRGRGELDRGGSLAFMTFLLPVHADCACTRATACRYRYASAFPICRPGTVSRP